MEHEKGKECRLAGFRFSFSLSVLHFEPCFTLRWYELGDTAKHRQHRPAVCRYVDAAHHIVGVTGFRMDDRTLKRSGLDYWDEVELHRPTGHQRPLRKPACLAFCISRQKRGAVVRGLELSRGRLPCFQARDAACRSDSLREELGQLPDHPNAEPKVRSLNLATTVGIVLLRGHKTERPSVTNIVTNLYIPLTSLNLDLASKQCDV